MMSLSLLSALFRELPGGPQSAASRSVPSIPKPREARTLEHHIIYKRGGVYAAFPQLDHQPDGRVAAGFSISHKRDHFVIGEWVVFASDDGGRTWTPSTDRTIPHNWPAPTTREYSDRFNAVLSDGTYLCAGSAGWAVWEEHRRSEAEEAGMLVLPHPWLDDRIAVRERKLFVQYSEDRGDTWVRREWALPGFRQSTAFSRGTMLVDGTVLVPVYGADKDGNGRNMVWRSGSDGKGGWRLLPLGNQSKDMNVNETAFVEVERDRVLALSRNASGYFTQMWSDDGGRAWSEPLLTDIWAPHSPPHLLKLRDGRILCSYGYRRSPMGIRAVLSNDGGETWDTADAVVLRDDGGTPTQSMATTDHPDLEALRLSGDEFRRRVGSTVIRARYPPENARPDLGYTISTQLEDDTILTVYYITLDDGITHCACTRWQA